MCTAETNSIFIIALVFCVFFFIFFAFVVVSDEIIELGLARKSASIAAYKSLHPSNVSMLTYFRCIRGVLQVHRGSQDN